MLIQFGWLGICLYFTDFEDVIVTVKYLMEKNPQAQFWTTYQVRRYGSIKLHFPLLKFETWRKHYHTASAASAEVQYTCFKTHCIHWFLK